MKSKSNNKEKNPRAMYMLCCFLQGFFGILPIMIHVIIQWNTYFGNKNTCISNAFGLAIAGVFIVMIFTKQTKILKGLGGFVIFAIIVTLMKSVISDLYMISWCAVIGMVFAKTIGIWTEKWANILKAKPNIDTMNILGDKIVNAISNGRG